MQDRISRAGGVCIPVLDSARYSSPHIYSENQIWESTIDVGLNRRLAALA